MSTALVTGPTSGLGTEFARQLAARGHDLVLVSRNEAKLRELAAELTEQHRIACEVLPADLSDADELRIVEARAGDRDRPLDWLINNAGFGISEPFVGGDLDAEQRMLDVLVRAPLRLTHAVLPPMVERGHGRVVVVSSIAGFVTAGTYSAAKAWATTFAEGLHAELRDTDVHVTALCPGYVRTNFHMNADINAAHLPDIVWLNPDEVVATALKDADRGRVISIPSLRYQVMASGVRLVPRSIVRRFSTMNL